MFTNVCNGISSSYDKFITGADKFFDQAVKLTTLKGLGKIGSVAKAAFTSYSLYRHGEVKPSPIIEAFDGLKTVDNTFSWTKLGGIVKKTTDGILDLANRILLIGIAIINLIDFASKNIVDAFSKVTPAVMGISFYVGSKVQNAVPLKLAVGTAMTTIDLTKNLYDLYSNHVKKTSLENKLSFFTATTNVEKEIDLNPNPFQGKLEKLAKYLGPVITAKIKLNQATENENGDEAELLNVLDRMLNNSNKQAKQSENLGSAVKTEISLEEKTIVEEIVENELEVEPINSLATAKNFAILKAYKNRIEAKSETAKAKFKLEAEALNGMGDVNFVNFKIENLLLRKAELPRQKKTAMYNVAADVASLASSALSITSMAYGMHWFSSLIGVTELTGKKIIEGVALVSGVASLANFIREINAPVLPQKVGAHAFLLRQVRQVKDYKEI